jgi:hypothetical protein
MTRSTLLSAACALFALVGCKSHDLGKPCTIKSSGVLPTQPVGGESPLIEVVTVQRATECDSFQCLEDRGYAAYCTRECAVDTTGKVGPTCTTSADCTQPQHCFQGRCLNDDCPGGFECQTVQDVGPLEGKLFCVYKEHCRGSNRECEDLGTMECARLGCFDSTLKSGDSTLAPTLTCERRDKMTCQCGDGGTSCSGTALTCFGGPSHTQWPAGSVEIRDVCMRQGN